MKITVLCVGKLKEAFYKEAVAEYSKRLSRFASFSVIEVPDEKTPDHASAVLEEQIRQKEGNRLLEKIPGGAYVITLAIRGKKWDSPGLAGHLEGLMAGGESSLCFIIGGSLGLSKEVLARADEALSFSDLTFPHQLMRVILCEQIYRCFKIIHKEPYHK